MPSVKWIKNLCGDKTKTYTKEPWILASACTVSEHWWIEKKTKIQGQTFLNRPFQTSSGWTHIKLLSSTLKLHLISSLITPHLMPLFFASCFCILFFMSANIELSPIFFVYCCCSHYFFVGPTNGMFAHWTMEGESEGTQLHNLVAILLMSTMCQICCDMQD